MARPVTLFTGQWADLPLEEPTRKRGELGTDFKTQAFDAAFAREE